MDRQGRGDVPWGSERLGPDPEERKKLEISDKERKVKRIHNKAQRKRNQPWKRVGAFLLGRKKSDCPKE